MINQFTVPCWVSCSSIQDTGKWNKPLTLIFFFNLDIITIMEISQKHYFFVQSFISSCTCEYLFYTFGDKHKYFAHTVSALALESSYNWLLYAFDTPLSLNCHCFLLSTFLLSSTTRFFRLLCISSPGLELVISQRSSDKHIVTVYLFNISIILLFPYIII